MVMAKILILVGILIIDEFFLDEFVEAMAKLFNFFGRK